MWRSPRFPFPSSQSSSHSDGFHITFVPKLSLLDGTQVPSNNLPLSFPSTCFWPWLQFYSCKIVLLKYYKNQDKFTDELQEAFTHQKLL